MATTAGVEKHEFQAETRQLLDLMIHSLYTNKEIFLRELISNASDALDRLRFEALTHPELLAGDEPLEIRLETDEQARTLTLHDNGIGMSRQEVIDNIGTIAKSGSRELMERIRASRTDGEVAQLIGQFGVGFYSSFMAADHVTLLTRRAGEESATLWQSSGGAGYSLVAAERPGRGTSVTLRLKPVDRDDGIDDFTDEWVLSRIVKRYSDFIPYPIRLKVRREGPAADGEGGAEGAGETVIEDKTLNSQKPIWLRPEGEIRQQELAEFYKHISHDWNEPRQHIYLRGEGRVEYRALLFIPEQAPYDLFYVASKPGLQLYVKNVLIMERCEELTPRYLRFVRGVVDSPDLPLNISREMLQHDRHITQIRRWITRKLLDTLRTLQADEPAEYREFWQQFGRALKEGVAEDFDNRERLLELLLFESSADPAALTTLKEYVGRMQEGQEPIYYLTGESRAQVEGSPHLEALAARGYEVLFLVDPVDELMMQSLQEYDGKRFKDVGKGTVELGAPEERETSAKALEEKQRQVGGLLEAMQRHLDAQVKQVRLSGRLTHSPVCLVGADHDYSPQLERLLQKGKGGGPAQRRIMELNPAHPIVEGLAARFARDADDPAIRDAADLLLGFGLLAEGSELPDPARFTRLVAGLVERDLERPAAGAGGAGEPGSGGGGRSGTGGRGKTPRRRPADRGGEAEEATAEGEAP